MSTITELKDQINTKTINLVLLTMATYGIYLIIWLNDNYKIIDRITKMKTADDTYIIWIAVCSGLGGLFASMGKDLVIIQLMLSIAYSVLCVVWAFRAKKALQEYCLIEYKIDLRMNAFYTVIFNIFYINFCINDLPEAQRKHQILTGQSAG